ncbi:MAG: hypothetical protein JXN59_12535 [Anaerolineae bacterium]|nr:hypothetical protein [Anaerolineae bacterium]
MKRISDESGAAPHSPAIGLESFATCVRLTEMITTLPPEQLPVSGEGQSVILFSNIYLLRAAAAPVSNKEGFT